MTGIQLPVIRPMTESDLEQVLMIEQASFPSPWLREHFLHELHSSYSFPLVAEYDGAVAGYVCLMSLFEQSQILDIAVGTEQRGRGIGLSLAESAIGLAREKGAELISLEVRVSAFAAIGLYERLGFRRVGIRSNYYESREDAILMEKNLKETT